MCECEKTTMVVSAFPACGKSWIYSSPTKRVILDSDSSEFSWIKNDKGEKVRNPEFPANYIKHIKDNIGSADIIFVSSHLAVRQAMTDAGINYVTVYPEADMKEEWIGRCFCRGNDMAFINFINSSWDTFMKDIVNEPYGDKLYRLGHKEYLSSILNQLENDWLARIYSNKERTGLANSLRLSEDEIYQLVTSFILSGKKSADVADYRLSKAMGGGTRLTAEIVLGPASEFYGRPDCPFIVDDIEGLIIWDCGHKDSIHSFCKTFRKAFEETAFAIGKRLKVDFSSYDASANKPLFFEGVRIERKSGVNMLKVYISTQA